MEGLQALLDLVPCPAVLSTDWHTIDGPAGWVWEWLAGLFMDGGIH